MERIGGKPVVELLARCPNCNSLCVNGHDDDNQICCAKCWQTFLPKSYVKMTDEEYKKMTEKATHKYEHCGWIAFTTG